MRVPSGVRPRRPSSGVTLLEMVVVGSVIVVLMAAIAATSNRANDHYRVSQTRSALNGQAGRVLDRICDELAYTRESDLVPPPLEPFGSERLDYQACAGFAAGLPVWGTGSRIALEYDRGEIDDGLDNNGNGLVDEGQVVLVRDVGLPTEQTVVLCHGVREYQPGETANGLDDDGNGLRDERGLSFLLEGEVLTIRLSLEDLDHKGRAHAVTHETSILIRN